MITDFTTSTGPMTKAEKLGTRIVQLRARMGKTQDQFALLIGVHKNHLSRIENGNISELLKNTMEKVEKLENKYPSSISPKSKKEAMQDEQ